jgi:predicted DNA-binding protein
MKTAHLSLKIPQETHQRLKIYSVITGKSMSQIIVDYVESLEIEVPTLKGKKEDPERTV